MWPLQRHRFEGWMDGTRMPCVMHHLEPFRQQPKARKKLYMLGIKSAASANTSRLRLLNKVAVSWCKHCMGWF